MKVIQQMSEADLESFLPKVSDRIIVKLFAEEQLKKKATQAQTDKKEKLLKPCGKSSVS